MMKATRDTTARRHPPHIRIWENPEAHRIEKLPCVTWFGHCVVHIATALNELPPEARGPLVRDLIAYLHRQGQAIARRERDKAKRGRS
jgi:hypothetical protein